MNDQGSVREVKNSGSEDSEDDMTGKEQKIRAVDMVKKSKPKFNNKSDVKADTNPSPATGVDMPAIMALLAEIKDEMTTKRNYGRYNGNRGSCYTCADACHYSRNCPYKQSNPPPANNNQGRHQGHATASNQPNYGNFPQSANPSNTRVTKTGNLN